MQNNTQALKIQNTSNLETFLTTLEKVNKSHFLTYFLPVVPEMGCKKRITFNMLNKSQEISVTKKSN